MRRSTAIGKLIDACLDDMRMLEHESRTVTAERRAVLDGLAAERARFALQLGDFVGDDERAHAGSWRESWRELALSLRSALGGPSDSDAVDACLRSCRRTSYRFDRALELPWPDAVLSVLLTQRAALTAARDALVDVQF